MLRKQTHRRWKVQPRKVPWSTHLFNVQLINKRDIINQLFWTQLSTCITLWSSLFSTYVNMHWWFSPRHSWLFFVNVQIFKDFSPFCCDLRRETSWSSHIYPNICNLNNSWKEIAKLQKKFIRMFCLLYTVYLLYLLTHDSAMIWYCKKSWSDCLTWCMIYHDMLKT